MGLVCLFWCQTRFGSWEPSPFSKKGLFFRVMNWGWEAPSPGYLGDIVTYWQLICSSYWQRLCFPSSSCNLIWWYSPHRSNSATFLRNCGTTDWPDVTQPQNHGTRPKTVQRHVFYWKKNWSETHHHHWHTISNKIYQLISNYVHLKWFPGSSWKRGIWCTSLVVNQVFKQPFLQALLRVLGGTFCWNQYVSPWLAGCLSY